MTTTSRSENRRQRLSPGIRRAIAVALAGYLVVAIFGIAYGVVLLTWPGSVRSVAIVVGILAALPLGLSLVWDRVATVKALGVEVTLSQIVVPVEQSIPSALSSVQYFSVAPAIIEQLQRAVGDPKVQLLEVDLRSHPYWWPTRLFLQAALADDYSHIQRFVFVERDRHYVGMSSTHEIRCVLDAKFPSLELERRYREIRGTFPSSEIPTIVNNWVAAAHWHSPNRTESEITPRVTSTELRQWLESSLETRSVTWSDVPDRILRYDARFVAVVRHGRLVEVVDADALARHSAAVSLRRMFS